MDCKSCNLIRRRDSRRGTRIGIARIARMTDANEACLLSYVMQLPH